MESTIFLICQSCFVLRTGISDRRVRESHHSVQENHFCEDVTCRTGRPCLGLQGPRFCSMAFTSFLILLRAAARLTLSLSDLFGHSRFFRSDSVLFDVLVYALIAPV